MSVISSRALEIEAYERAAKSLLALIRGEQFASHSHEIRRQRAKAKLVRIRTMLRGLGDPQLCYPVVHVTGTSGKGSTAANVAAILTAAGYRVGLRTSPYLQVATEKLQIGSSLIDAASFDAMVRRVLGEASRVYPPDQSGLGISYAEAWAVLGYWWFALRDIDIAVVEVGAGGRFDATNVIDPIVSVITSVGLDHVVTLGPSIEDIAWHKAGVIKPGATVVLGAIPDEALSVIAREAHARGARVVRTCAVDASPRLLPMLQGAFRRRNAEVAAVVAAVLRENGFDVPDAAIFDGILSTRLPGRLEQMPSATAPTVWIDGAHNADKAASLAQEANRISSGGPLPIIVLGVLDTKDPAAVVSALRPAASAMVLTEPAVVGRRSLEADKLADVVLADGFQGELYVEPDPDSAVRRAESIAKPAGSTVLVTGSMYLAGHARRRWYRDEDIVIQRTPWPCAAGEIRLPAP
ncbi:MAG: bifunctional folylpolyglutamate synthase/dihydrofolate synthase [Chloroflexi bacterium]|nr:bifunctional folylpolyglutamate synthase/dihydrofolate synthase [Chloroflexota bacterium]